jgi:hypothetical protein
MQRIGLIALTGAFLLAAAPLHAAVRFCDFFKIKTDPAWGDQNGDWTIAKHVRAAGVVHRYSQQQ